MIDGIRRTPTFKRDYKRAMRLGRSRKTFLAALELLVADERELLRTRYRDHALKGKWSGYRELHLEGDWLLIYKIESDTLVLVLTSMGSHDDLF